ncbi:MAG: CinA family protein [Propionibacteriaceae bacterium]|nr:CinA family protein [Propionibacteriaceae bacterium]
MSPNDLIERLAQRGQTLATCESITGGLIAGALTEVPGASKVFRGALITYATDLKVSLGGLDPELIGEHGVVSEAVARAMAEGACWVCGTDWGIGVTGVAGPGASDGVEPGTAWLAIAGPGEVTTSFLLEETGERTAIRQAVVARALEELDQASR